MNIMIIIIIHYPYNCDIMIWTWMIIITIEYGGDNYDMNMKVMIWI